MLHWVLQRGDKRHSKNFSEDVMLQYVDQSLHFNHKTNNKNKRLDSNETF